jgi:hypothetical protein
MGSRFSPNVVPRNVAFWEITLTLPGRYEYGSQNLFPEENPSRCAAACRDSGVVLIAIFSLGPLTFWTAAIPAVCGPLLLLPAIFSRHRRPGLTGVAFFVPILLCTLPINIAHPTSKQILQAGAVLWFSASFFMALFFFSMDRLVARFLGHCVPPANRESCQIDK